MSFYKLYTITTTYLLVAALSGAAGYFYARHDECNVTDESGARSSRALHARSQLEEVGRGETWCNHMCGVAVGSEMESFDPNSGECTCK